MKPNGRMLACNHCGREYYRKKSLIEESKFCSRPCQDRSVTFDVEKMVKSIDTLECVEWPAARGDYGYGKCTFRGKHTSTHIAAFTISNGRPPTKGMYVCHSCDNPPCFNPRHLFEGTHLDNTHDSIRKGRNTRGSDSHYAKLTEENVIAIRADSRRYADIAASYGVTKSNICIIKKRRSWKHI